MALLVVMAWAGLRLIGFKKTQQLAHRKITKPLGAENSSIFDETADIDYAQRCAELTAIAARHCLPSGSCLPQSLALCWLLRKNGLDAQLKIGVIPQSETLLAHAWVEYQNLALGQQESNYQSFPLLTQ
jgi:hypothetical protein